MKRVIFFDIGGTLIKTKTAIRNALAHILHGEITEQTVTDFAGAPAVDALIDCYDFSLAQAQPLIAAYFDYFEQQGVYECTPQEGIGTVLADLKKHGILLFAVSSKRHSVALKLMEQTGLAPYFTEIRGAEADGSCTSKEDIIHSVMTEYSLWEKDKILLVGDRWQDLTASQILGIDFVGAAYGYAQPNEFRALPPARLADSTENLRKILLNKISAV